MLNLVQAWIILSAALCAAGWGLSVMHQLNRRGYAVVLGVLGLGAWWMVRTHKDDA